MEKGEKKRWTETIEITQHNTRENQESLEAKPNTLC